MKFKELFSSKTTCFLQHPIRLETLPSKNLLQLYFIFPLLKISIKNSSLFQTMYLIQTPRAKDQRALRKKTVSLNYTFIFFLGPNEHTIFNSMFNRSLMPHEIPALPPHPPSTGSLFWELVENEIQQIYDFQTVLQMQTPKRRGITLWTLLIIALKKLEYV